MSFIIDAIKALGIILFFYLLFSWATRKSKEEKDWELKQSLKEMKK